MGPLNNSLFRRSIACLLVTGEDRPRDKTAAPDILLMKDSNYIVLPRVIAEENSLGSLREVVRRIYPYSDVQLEVPKYFQNSGKESPLEVGSYSAGQLYGDGQEVSANIFLGTVSGVQNPTSPVAFWAPIKDVLELDQRGFLLIGGLIRKSLKDLDTFADYHRGIIGKEQFKNYCNRYGNGFLGPTLEPVVADTNGKVKREFERIKRERSSAKA